MTYNIIQHRGRQNKAITNKGAIVRRSESFFVEEHGIVKCADYDQHFLYETNAPGQSAFMCTCGSPAVIKEPEKRSKMFVCLNHATYGFHATSQVNKADFEKGQPIIRKARRWG